MSRKLPETSKGSSDMQDHTNMLGGVKEGYMQMMQLNGHFDIADMAVARLRGRQASTNAHGSYASRDEEDLTLSLGRYGGGTTMDLNWTAAVRENLQGIGGWIESTLVTAERGSYAQWH